MRGLGIQIDRRTMRFNAFRNYGRRAKRRFNSTSCNYYRYFCNKFGEKKLLKQRNYTKTPKRFV